MNIGKWIKNEYDTLTTRPNRDAQYYLLRHLRRRGLLNVDGGGRLARFGRISRLKRVCPRTVIEGRLDRIFVAEYEHYVWRVRPHCVYCGILLTRSTLTRDHVVPRAHGGGGGENLVPSCGPCNRAKGCCSLLQFLVARTTCLRHDVRAVSYGGPSAPVESAWLTGSPGRSPPRRWRSDSAFGRGGGRSLSLRGSSLSLLPLAAIDPERTSDPRS